MSNLEYLFVMYEKMVIPFILQIFFHIVLFLNRLFSLALIGKCPYCFSLLNVFIKLQLSKREAYNYYKKVKMLAK